MPCGIHRRQLEHSRALRYFEASSSSFSKPVRRFFLGFGTVIGIRRIFWRAVKSDHLPGIHCQLVCHPHRCYFLWLRLSRNSTFLFSSTYYVCGHLMTGNLVSEQFCMILQITNGSMIFETKSWAAPLAFRGSVPVSICQRSTQGHSVCDSHDHSSFVNRKSDFFPCFDFFWAPLGSAISFSEKWFEKDPKENFHLWSSTAY